MLPGLALCFGVVSIHAQLSGTPIGNNPDHAIFAFDGNPDTRYTASSNTYSWVGLDLGEPHVITEVKWVPPMGREDILQLGVFQGANSPDFLDAIPMAFIYDPSRHEAKVECSRGFRYVRFVGPVNSFCQINELEFYGVPGKGDDSGLFQITNLPTVVVNTVEGELPYDKEHDIACNVIIISENGADILEKEAGIRERGNMSRTFPKKPYRIKFDKKQNVLDAPAKAKKWTLINNYGDKTLMRNMLGFDIAAMMGMRYVPYCRPVDVVVNGDYKGCYQLCDQVEVNENRIDIEEMTPEDNSGWELTGGYFIEVDSYAYAEPVWFVSQAYGIPVTIKSPDDDEITPEQRGYIEDYFNKVESRLDITSTRTGYRNIFDMESFIQHMLVNELVGNTDTYWSVNMYKYREDPKIYTGPVWDMDLGFDNDNPVYPVTQNSGNGFLWETHFPSTAGGMINFARKVLKDDPQSAGQILEVWSEARGKGLSMEWLKDKVDEYAALLDASQRLNFIRWPIMNIRVHGNPTTYGSYENECAAVKIYIDGQMPHLDKIIGYKEPVNDDSATVGVVETNDYAVPVYYNLQGNRICNPLPGMIVIENRGDKTRKLKF